LELGAILESLLGEGLKHRTVGEPSPEFQVEIAEALEEVELELSSATLSSVEPLGQALKHVVGHRGKLFRPWAVILGWYAVAGVSGASANQDMRRAAVRVAVAAELAHMSSLVHDDIIDRDSKRRGAPTIHSVWGQDVGIIAGDYLLIKAIERMVSCAYLPGVRMEHAMDALKHATKAGLRMCEGETLDSLALGRTLTVNKYLKVIDLKTSSLIKGCFELGAIMAGASRRQRLALVRFGAKVGTAFQIVDDVLSLTSENEEVTGKPWGSDVRNGKLTLVLVHALENRGGATRAELLSLYGVPDLDATKTRRVVDIFKESGSIDFAVATASRLVEEAKAELEELAGSPAKELLLFLADVGIRRGS
jgi:geranylgeranyl pyrophosphate synthase